MDASVVVSAALVPGGTPRNALLAARARGTIALSRAIYDEIAEVLQRPKFARVLGTDRRLESSSC
ncbi:MAG: hypothetical protein M0Z28_27585 [Rhodospirillales bacterium]|nr:hypothetical protein [Rhodospirillales bacterium]